MSSISAVGWLRNRYVIAGLALLFVAASTLATLRFLRKEEVVRQTERVERAVEAEYQAEAAALLAKQEAEREQLAREQAEREGREAAERAEAEEQARLALLEQQRLERERARQRELRRRAEEKRRRQEREQEEARLQRLAEERAAREQAKDEAAARRKAEEDAAHLAKWQALQDELARKSAERKAKDAAAEEKAEARESFEDEQDETPTVETENTIDRARETRGWKSNADLRPIVTFDTEEDAEGTRTTEGWNAGFRARLGVTWGLLRGLHLGARVAGVCFTDECDVDFVLESATPAGNGLSGGQFTFDQLYVHWFRTGRFDLALGRLQTRYVLRGGVYAKSLDRNDSNNTNVTWTDGLQATYRVKKIHEFELVLQRNTADGTGSIRQGPLNFDDSRARITYFAGYESIGSWGPVVQRALDISYLPNSVFEDGVPDGRRSDYWAPVGRIAVRWPNRRVGLRLRAGAEVGYATGTQTCESAMLPCSGNVSGLAWNIVASAMGFAPSHNIGINYARTGAGWYLSPQYGPNEELFEVRHQWDPKPKLIPLLEARIRWRRDLEQLVGTSQKADDFDFYLRATWEFTLKKY